MAHITLPDGRELDEPDTNTTILDYYRSEGARIVLDEEPVRFPIVFEGGKRVEAPAPPEVAGPGEFDPGKYTVSDVHQYLATLSDADRERVFALERDGKARPTILEGPFARFDPSAHNVEEVAAYLARTDITEDERARVMAAEKSAESPRKGIVDS
jgi:hypothetical protein